MLLYIFYMFWFDITLENFSIKIPDIVVLTHLMVTKIPVLPDCHWLVCF